MVREVGQKPAKIQLVGAYGTCKHLGFVEWSFAHVKQNGELLLGPGSGMVCPQMSPHKSPGAKRCAIALAARPLPPVHLHLVVCPLATGGIHFVRAGAAAVSTHIGPKVSKHVSPRKCHLG